MMLGRFMHCGKLGDLVYALPAIRALGGGRVYLRPDSKCGFGEEHAGTAISLLNAQPYVDDASLLHGETVQFDLDEFRKAAGKADNIAVAHLIAFGLEPKEADTAWLTIPDASKTNGHTILFARSLTREPVPGFWQLAYDCLGQEAAFVGTAEEHQEFKKLFGPIPLLKTKDLLELAAEIDACNLFIGNQSCPYAIAEGLKKPAILEVDSTCPNCIFHRNDVLHVRTEVDLWKIKHTRELLGLEPPGLASWTMPAPFLLDAPIAEAERRLSGLQTLRMKIAARLPVEVVVRHPGHWSEILRSMDGGDDLDGYDQPNTIVGLSPDAVTDALLETGYRILSRIATSEACPDLTGPLSRSLAASSEEAEMIEQSLQLRSVEIKAEPIPPIIDERTAGALGPAAVEGCSVIILTYNSASSIEACLNSVLPSLRQKDELILVDNASSDNTIEIAKALLEGKHKIIQNEANLGFSAGINVGLRASRGRLLAVLNPDTVVPANWLDRLERRFEDPLTAAVGPVSDCASGIQYVGHHLPEDRQQGLSDLEIRQILDQTRAGRNLIVKLLIGFCMVLRRSALDKAGLFDEDLFLGSDDLELSWRLRTHGFRLVVARDVHIRHEGGSSFQSKPKAEIEELLRQSSIALNRKIRAAYAPGPAPTSIQLFDNPIFAHMLGHKLNRSS